MSQKIKTALYHSNWFVFVSLSLEPNISKNIFLNISLKIKRTQKLEKYFIKQIIEVIIIVKLTLKGSNLYVMKRNVENAEKKWLKKDIIDKRMVKGKRFFSEEGNLSNLFRFFPRWIIM